MCVSHAPFDASRHAAAYLLFGVRVLFAYFLTFTLYSTPPHLPFTFAL